MKENEKAIEQLERISKKLGDIGETEDWTEVAIQALEEVQQYRQVGTVEFLAQATKLANLAKKCGTIGKVIDECAEYEEIGTVEECRSAVEKQTAKKPIRFDKCTCPSCGTYNETWKKRRNTLPSDIVYCWHCGQSVEIVRRENDGKID